MQNRAGRLILNSIYSVLAWSLPVALGLLVTPYLLKTLGVEAYGVYLVILGLIGYSFTFNLSKAVAKFVAEYGVTGETRKINSAITAAFLLSLAFGILGSIVIGLLSEWAVTDLLQITPELQRSARIALMIGGASIPFFLIGLVFQNILQGSHRFGALSFIVNLNWVLLSGGNVILVYLGAGIDSLLIWTVVAACVTAIISYIAARRAEPEYRLAFRDAGEMVRPVASYGSSIFLYQFFGSVMLVFERAWLTRSFGAETAAYYLVPMGLVFYFHAFMSNLTAAIFPVLNELLADRERLLELYKKSTKLLVSLTVLFLLSTIAGGHSFLKLWIDPLFADSSSPLLVIHAITFGLIVVMMAVWQVNEVFHAARVNSLVAGIWAVITITLMMLAADRWNAEGIALSRTIGVAVTLPAIALIERRFFGAVQWRFWRQLITKIGAAACVLAAIEYLVFFSTEPGWLGLVIGLGAGALGYAATLYFTGFVSPDERAALLQVFGIGRQSVQ